MKTGHELQNMLDDVLHDDMLDALKEDLRLRCVMELARKRRSRLKVWMIPAAAALLFVVFRLILWIDSQAGITAFPGGTATAKTPSYFVTTSPLTASERLSTSDSIGQADMVRTPVSRDFVINTTGAPERVSTKATPQVARLTDREFLAQFPDTPCGFLGTGKGEKTLVFLNPEAEEKFLFKIKG
jgi:hypothetical protein